MTVFGIGDYHGESINPFLEEEQPSLEDEILSTGDFDRTSIIHELLSIKNNPESASVTDVIGNHDHALLEKISLNSSTIKSQDLRFQEMVEELHSDSEAKKYIDNLSTSQFKEFQVGPLDGVLVHGGLAGYLQNPDIPDEVKPFWYRLWYEEDFQENLGIMAENDYDIMVRGHDHWTEHAFRAKCSNEEISYHLPEAGDSYNLEEDFRHIITHGPWYEGNYIKLDEETLELSFKSL